MDGKTLRRLEPERRGTKLSDHGPDETASNWLDAVFEATDASGWSPPSLYDTHLAQDVRVMDPERASLLVDHQNRNVRSSNDLGSLAAQKNPLDPTVPMGGHDDQVAPLLLRRINDSRGR